MTDQQLLAAFRADRSPDHLCELAHRHYPMVRAAALRDLADPHAADDVAQAVFLVFLRRAAEISPSALLAGWLFQTTRHITANIRRERLRRSRHEQKAAGMERILPSEPAPEDLTPLLNDALAALRAPDRNALLLKYLEGRSTSAVALALGASENTTRQRLARALARLRKILHKRGFLASLPLLAAALDPHHTTAASNLPPTITALLRGTPPPPHILSLSHGGIHMMRIIPILLIATSTAAAITLAATIAIVTGAHAATPAPTTAPAALPPAVPAPVSGRVVRADDPKTLVPNALLFYAIFDDQTPISVVDPAAADGTFQFRRITVDFYLFAISPDGSRAGVVRLSPNDDNITLPVAPAATVTGLLLDAAGYPIPNQRLYCSSPYKAGEVTYGGDTRTFTTDAQGRFTVPGLIPGYLYDLMILGPEPALHAAALLEPKTPGLFTQNATPSPEPVRRP